MSDRLKIGVIGLGDIARKAYLPVLAERADVELHLCTRDKATLDELGERYRLPHRTTSVGELLAGALDAVFVHAATAAHAELVSAALVSGAHVYVDKPLDDNADGARRLAGLAAERGRSLMVGFNRRYAPAYAALLEQPRDLIVFQKNRGNEPGLPRQVVFDDFIHVVDTLRFLVPGEVTTTRCTKREVGGLLHHLVLELSGDGFTALGIMNRVAAASEERLEVSGGGHKRTVLDLATIIDDGEPARTTRRGDWTPVADQRGIAQACEAFLNAVRSGMVLSPADALATHDVCEQLVHSGGR